MEVVLLKQIKFTNFVDNVDIVSVLGDSRNEKKFITKKLNKNVKLKSFLKKFADNC